MIFSTLVCSSLLAAMAGCNHEQTQVIPAIPDADTIKAISYLALGDSYTIGQSVAAVERFPRQLADSLSGMGYETTLKIIAQTGWTTADLKAGIQAANITGNTYDLVTLLIGVNNQYRGFSIGGYQTEFTQLLEQAILFAGNDPLKVVVLSIPDYAYTPFGQNRPNPNEISQQIDAFNAACQEITVQHGVLFVDITPISREGLDDPALVAPDKLHPSGSMYARWVTAMLPGVLTALNR